MHARRAVEYQDEGTLRNESGDAAGRDGSVHVQGVWD